MNITPFTKIIQSPKASLALRIVLAIFILFIVFWAGMGVGYRKAEFSSRFSDRYFRMFGGHGLSPIGMMGLPDVDELVSGHGATGKVLSVNLPTFVVTDNNNVEKSIIINNETIIRGGRDMLASTTIHADDFVVVIGNPDQAGHITAKLIRVIPSPMMSSTTDNKGNIMYTK